MFPFVSFLFSSFLSPFYTFSRFSSFFSFSLPLHATNVFSLYLRCSLSVLLIKHRVKPHRNRLSEKICKSPGLSRRRIISYISTYVGDKQLPYTSRWQCRDRNIHTDNVTGSILPPPRHCWNTCTYPFLQGSEPRRTTSCNDLHIDKEIWIFMYTHLYGDTCKYIRIDMYTYVRHTERYMTECTWACCLERDVFWL